MDRFHQISAEIIRLYRQQLNLWVLGKIADLKDADLLQYDHRRDRIEELREELESMVSGAWLAGRPPLPKHDLCPKSGSSQAAELSRTLTTSMICRSTSTNRLSSRILFRASSAVGK